MRSVEMAADSAWELHAVAEEVERVSSEVSHFASCGQAKEWRKR